MHVERIVSQLEKSEIQTNQSGLIEEDRWPFTDVF